MKLYTSYFANIRNIPNNILPCAIIYKLPKGFNGLHYPKLGPSYSIFSEYKATYDTNRYTQRYINEILYYLNPQEVVNDLYLLGNGNDIVMLCYERPNLFCHRHIVSNWLNNNGFECFEFGF